MAEDSNEQVTKKRKTEPPPTGSTVVNDVLGKLHDLKKIEPRGAGVVTDYFNNHGSYLLKH